jgi:hypothetical protein
MPTSSSFSSMVPNAWKLKGSPFRVLRPQRVTSLRSSCLLNRPVANCSKRNSCPDAPSITALDHRPPVAGIVVVRPLWQ